MVSVPHEAVTAAAKVHHGLHCGTCRLWPEGVCEGEPTELDTAAARQLLEAAAPHIAAAERERITLDVEAQFVPPRGAGAFADGWHSAVDEFLDILADPEHKLAPFADLLREQP